MPEYGDPLGANAPFAIDRPVHLDDLVACGLTKPLIDELVARDVIRRVTRATYVASQMDDSIELRAQALGLVVPESAIVVDRTAAWLHGVDLLRRGVREELPEVQLFTREGTRIRRAGVEGGRRTLIDVDVTAVHGIRVTTPLRTALDLGRLLWRFDGLAALDAFARTGVSMDRMLHELPRFRGARGVVQLRSLVPLVDGRAESPAESALRLHWYDAGLPRPQVQWWIEIDGVETFRLDLALPDEGYAAEFDGEAFHTGQADRDGDAERRTVVAREHRYHFEVFTKADIYTPAADPCPRLVTGRRKARIGRGLNPYG